MNSNLNTGVTTIPTRSDLENYRHCVLGGNWLMIISLLITSGCVTMTFGYEQAFTLPAVIAGHIFTIVFAGLFKLGYVVRCVGMHGLGYQSF